MYLLIFFSCHFNVGAQSCLSLFFALKLFVLNFVFPRHKNKNINKEQHENKLFRMLFDVSEQVISFYYAFSVFWPNKNLLVFLSLHAQIVTIKKLLFYKKNRR